MKPRGELDQIHAEVDFGSWRFFIEEAHRRNLIPYQFFNWLSELDPRDPTQGGFSVFMAEPLYHLLKRIREQEGAAKVFKSQLKILRARTRMGSSDERKPQRTVLLEAPDLPCGVRSQQSYAM